MIRERGLVLQSLQLSRARVEHAARSALQCIAEAADVGMYEAPPNANRESLQARASTDIEAGILSLSTRCQTLDRTACHLQSLGTALIRRQFIFFYTRRSR